MVEKRMSATVVNLCDDSDDDDDVICIGESNDGGDHRRKLVASKTSEKKPEVICLDDGDDKIEDVIIVDGGKSATNSTAASADKSSSARSDWRGGSSFHTSGKRKRDMNVESSLGKGIRVSEADDVVVVKEKFRKKKIPKKGADRRLFRERQKMLQKSPDGIEFLEKKSSARTWFLRITGAKGTMYDGKTYRLRFRFTDKYPIKPPEVVFVGGSPIHEHIYSNGHICLSILYDQWSPALSVNSVCLSILSMMSSCTKEGFSWRNIN